jgi:carotenoid cleavage dioxygenase-like enzyme
VWIGARYTLAPAIPPLRCFYDVAVMAVRAAPAAGAPPPAPAALDAAVAAATVSHRVPVAGRDGTGPRYPAYQHSFAVTEDFAVLVEAPLRFSPRALAATAAAGGPFTDMFVWDGAGRVEVRVIRLADGEEVARVPLPGPRPWFALHHINAWQDGSGGGGGGGGGTVITLDTIAYADPRVLRAFHLADLRAGRFGEGTSTTVRRVTVNIDTGAATDEPVAVPVPAGPAGGPPCVLGVDAALELPAVAPAVVGLRHRYVYAVRARRGAFMDGLVKIDAGGGGGGGGGGGWSAVAWDSPHGVPSEPVFVPRPPCLGGSGREDDGVVLSVVLDGCARRSFVAVLDAATFVEVARVGLPGPVPMTFHGSWVGSGGSESRGGGTEGRGAGGRGPVG